MNLVALLLAAAHGPLVGATRANSLTRHAITFDRGSLRDWPHIRRVPAACGAMVKVLWPFDWWAPAIRGTDLARCVDCVERHGARRRRPPKWMAA